MKYNRVAPRHLAARHWSYQRSRIWGPALVVPVWYSHLRKSRIRSTTAWARRSGTSGIGQTGWLPSRTVANCPNYRCNRYSCCHRCYFHRRNCRCDELMKQCHHQACPVVLEYIQRRFAVCPPWITSCCYHVLHWTASLPQFEANAGGDWRIHCSPASRDCVHGHFVWLPMAIARHSEQKNRQNREDQRAEDRIANVIISMITLCSKWKEKSILIVDRLPQYCGWHFLVYLLCLLSVCLWRHKTSVFNLYLDFALRL